MERKHILLIEDEDAIAENVIYALQTEGFETSWKQLAQEGLQILQQQTVDLLILDVGLPDISGFDLCKQIRQFSNIPIIFLTARSAEIDRIVGLEIGGDDYVCKPFSPRELSTRAKVILKRMGERQTAGHSNAPALFSINSLKNQIHYLGQQLELTRYEYLLLKTLLSKPEQVFSRQQLLDLLWDEPEACFDRVIDGHIKTLRAKLKTVNPDDPIQTHRGFGYSITAECREI